jgi:hypothetical protein
VDDKLPLKVKVTIHLHDDVKALVHLFLDEEPPKRPI